MHLQRCSSTPDRPVMAWEETWTGPDQGLIAAWEQGRRMRQQHDPAVDRAMAGELPTLPWRGGVERSLKSPRKPGAMLYLAMWQGLRGDDLDVTTDGTQSLTCQRGSDRRINPPRPARPP